jgi:hypothetical protein
MACSFDGNMYATPGFQSLGSVIALGDTIEETIDLLKERAEMVKAHQIEVNLADLDCITKQIDEGRELGVEF